MWHEMAQKKKYYWLKLKNDFFDDDAISWLEEQEHGAEYVLFYIKLCLKSLESDGYLIRKVGEMRVPYDTKRLAEITRTTFDTVVVAMELLKKMGMIEVLADGTLYLAQVEQMTGAETPKAEIMRRSRAKKKLAAAEAEAALETVPPDDTPAAPVCGNRVTTMFPEDGNIVDAEYREQSIENRDQSIEHTTTDPMRQTPEGSRTEDGQGDGEEGAHGHTHTPPPVEAIGETASAPAADDCQPIIDLYHSICTSYPKLRGLSEKRKKAIRARARVHPQADFRLVFEHAQASRFLKGGNPRNWSADFDWMMCEGNFDKILEGKYDDHTPTEGGNTHGTNDTIPSIPAVLDEGII